MIGFFELCFNSTIFLNEIQLSLFFEMKFKNFYFEKTVLLIAVEKGNKEIIQLLLSIPEVDVNAHLIYNCLFFFISFHNHFFLNKIQK